MIPKYNEMYNEFLESIQDEAKYSLREITNKVSSLLKLTEMEQKTLCENGRATIIYYRLGWTKTYLLKAGLVEAVTRGIFKITPEGLSLLNNNISITNSYLLKYESFVEFFKPNKISKDLGTTNQLIDEKDKTPDESIDDSIGLLNRRLSDDLISMVRSKDPYFFERLVLNLLDNMGYAFNKESIIRTPDSNDGGIDGIINEDEFGFNSIYIQAKCWKADNVVGRSEIQKFLGAVAGQGGNKGLFITTSRFTKSALDYAEKQLQVKLILVDGKRFAELMIKYNLGVNTIKKYEIKEIDNDYFNGDLLD